MVAPGEATRCRRCGTAFNPRRRWQRFCSTACRIAFHAEARHREFAHASRVLAEAGYTNVAEFLTRHAAPTTTLRTSEFRHP
jgi:hypothetical protein